jgi:hypothetical protein
LDGTPGCLIYRLGHQTEVGHPGSEITSQAEKERISALVVGAGREANKALWSRVIAL